MKIKFLIGLSCLLLLSSVTVPTIACCEGDPPGNPACYECEDRAWVLKDSAECGQDSDCTGACHNGCSDCSCANDDTKCTGCKSCVDGECEDDNSKCSTILNCEECNNGTCENRCPPLGKYCDWAGECVECRSTAHCDDECKQCLDNECKHGCTACYTPWYCANACYCTDCSTEEDYDECNVSKNEDYECDNCDDTMNPSCPGTMREYTGNAKITCTTTHSDCSNDDHLCYTVYNCTVSGFVPLHSCGTGDMPTNPPSCLINLDFPSLCRECGKDSSDEGDPWYTDNNTCPTEEWP